MCRGKKLHSQWTDKCAHNLTFPIDEFCLLRREHICYCPYVCFSNENGGFILVTEKKKKKPRNWFSFQQTLVVRHRYVRLRQHGHIFFIGKLKATRDRQKRAHKTTNTKHILWPDIITLPFFFVFFFLFLFLLSTKCFWVIIFGWHFNFNYSCLWWKSNAFKLNTKTKPNKRCRPIVRNAYETTIETCTLICCTTATMDCTLLYGVRWHEHWTLNTERRTRKLCVVCVFIMLYLVCRFNQWNIN